MIMTDGDVYLINVTKGSRITCTSGIQRVDNLIMPGRERGRSHFVCMRRILTKGEQFQFWDNLAPIGSPYMSNKKIEDFCKLWA